MKQNSRVRHHPTFFCVIERCQADSTGQLHKIRKPPRVGATLSERVSANVLDAPAFSGAVF